MHMQKYIHRYKHPCIVLFISGRDANKTLSFINIQYLVAKL